MIYRTQLAVAKFAAVAMVIIGCVCFTPEAADFPSGGYGEGSDLEEIWTYDISEKNAYESTETSSFGAKRSLLSSNDNFRFTDMKVVSEIDEGTGKQKHKVQFETSSDPTMANVASFKASVKSCDTDHVARNVSCYTREGRFVSQGATSSIASDEIHNSDGCFQRVDSPAVGECGVTSTRGIPCGAQAGAVCVRGFNNASGAFGVTCVGCPDALADPDTCSGCKQGLTGYVEVAVTVSGESHDRCYIADTQACKTATNSCNGHGTCYTTDTQVHGCKCDAFFFSSGPGLLQQCDTAASDSFYAAPTCDDNAGTCACKANSNCAVIAARPPVNGMATYSCDTSYPAKYMDPSGLSLNRWRWTEYSNGTQISDYNVCVQKAYHFGRGNLWLGGLQPELSRVCHWLGSTWALQQTVQCADMFFYRRHLSSE